MSTLNINTAFTGAGPTVWREQAISDAYESTPLEFLKSFSNAIVRDDDQEKMLYPNPNEGYTRSYQSKDRLRGTGILGTNGLVGNEEKLVGNAFTFQNQFVRNAIAFHIDTNAKDIILSEYAREERGMLADWAGRKKEKLDIGKMLTLAMKKTYGNGKAVTYATIGTTHILTDISYVVSRESLIDAKAKPVSFSEEEGSDAKHRAFVTLIDRKVLDAQALNADYISYVENMFQGAKFSQPVADIMYDKKQNMVIIPVDSEDGMGSPLRPQLIVGTAHASISNTGNADVLVGLPDWDGTSAYSTYSNTAEGKGIDFTEYLSNFIDASGATFLTAKIVAYDGSAVYTDMQIKLGSTNTTYTIDIKNGSGGAYVPAVGDVIYIQGACQLSLGKDAFVSSYPTLPWFSKQEEDYGAEQGIAINFWEGGTVIKNTRNIPGGVVLNFLYFDPLVGA